VEPVEYLRGCTRGVLVQLAGFGDLILALPAIDNLRAFFPGIRWTVVTRSPNGAILRNRVEDVRTLPWPPDVFHFPALVKEVLRLRRDRFDCALHLYNISSFRGAIAMKTFFMSIRPGLSIGRVSPYRLSLFDINWDETQSDSPHEVDLNLGMLRSLGVRCLVNVPSLSPAGDLVLQMSLLLKKQFPFAKQVVAICPGGTQVINHWPVTNYGTLALMLSQNGLGVCVLGGQADEQAASKIVEVAGKNAVSLAGRLSLQEVMALLAVVSMYVGNSSGPTHLAAALGIPCIGLYRPGDVNRFRPRGPGPIRILQSRDECTPCHGDNSDRHVCMETLPIEVVFNAVMEMSR
jgi:ADP-heptose:LPS heptosyltransferase